MNEHDFEVVEEMKRSGGGFAKALAEAFHRADVYNFGRLRRAFPDFWSDYADAARRRRHKGTGGANDGAQQDGAAEGHDGASGAGGDSPSGG